MLNFLKKNKTEPEERPQKVQCSCGGGCRSQPVTTEKTDSKNQTEVSIKILGTGCRNCHTLHDNAKALCEHKGINATVEYVTDLQKIMGYGVMSTPAIVINEKLVSVGRVFTESELELLFKELGIVDK